MAIFIPILFAQIVGTVKRCKRFYDGKTHPISIKSLDTSSNNTTFRIQSITRKFFSPIDAQTMHNEIYRGHVMSCHAMPCYVCECENFPVKSCMRCYCMMHDALSMWWNACHQASKSKHDHQQIKLIIFNELIKYSINN